LVVGFYTFVLPLLLAMSGLSAADSQLVLRAEITDSISFKRFTSFEQVTFVNVKRTLDGYQADPYRGESSSYSTLMYSNAFIITPPGKTVVKTGEEVEVHLLPGFFSLRDLFITR
jgi:molybdopterin biosynthesis enzyme